LNGEDKVDLEYQVQYIWLIWNWLLWCFYLCKCIYFI